MDNLATIPEEEEQPEPVTQRVSRVLAAPAREKNRPVTLLAIAAALAALAPLPAGPVAAALIVVVAAERGRR